MPDISSAVDSSTPGESKTIVVYTPAVDIKNTFSTSLVSHYRMEESSGSRSDSYASNTLSEDTGGVASAAGRQGTAADFETSTPGSRLYTASSNLCISGDLTWSVWAKFESLPAGSNTRTMMVRGPSFTSDGTRHIMARVITSGSLYTMQYAVSSDGYDSVTLEPAGFSLNTTDWFHFALVYKASTHLKVYLNGVEVGSLSTGIPASLNTSGSTNFYIGGGAGNAWDGLLDEMTLWSKELSASEIMSLYNNGSGIPYEVYTASVSDSITPSESTSTVVALLNISASDQTSIGETTDVTYSHDVYISTETQTITEDITAERADAIYVYDSQTITERRNVMIVFPLTYNHSPTPDMVIRYRERGGSVRRIT